MKRALSLAAGLAVLALAPTADAHVGSPDAVADGMAGPYHLLVTIRPPEVATMGRTMVPRRRIMARKWVIP